jgi:hypothetical protein
MAQLNGRDGLFMSDPRLDRMIIWSLSMLAIGILSMAVWVFNDLRAEIKGLNFSVAQLTTQVAVLEQTTVEIRNLRDYFENQQVTDRQMMETLRLRIRELELIAAEGGRRPGRVEPPK